MNISEIIMSEFNNAVLKSVDDLCRVVIPKEFRDRLLKNSRIVYMQIVKNYIILKIEDNDNTGTYKKLDKLGRFTLYKEVRNLLDIHVGDEVFVWTYKNYIILKKKEDKCVFCQETKKLAKYKEKNICQDCLNVIYKMKNIFVK